jgi:xylose dehydrogenase (NAD/NADP)
MTTSVVRWGILSTAKINRAIIPGARASEKTDLIAVASRDEERARAYADEVGIERSYGSYEALLADPDVDAVYISLPNSLHCEWSIRALDAGKHVLCEKPMSASRAEVEAAFDAAERNDRLLMEAFMYRHHPQTMRLRELVDEGAIGELRLVRTTFSFALDDLENVRMRPELEGGALMDVGCYCVSGTRLVAGEPEQVAAQQVVGPSGVDVRFAATMRFAGDVLAHFDCGFDMPYRAGLEAAGSEGTAYVASPWHCADPAIELRRGDEVERVTIEDVDRYQLQLENFSDAIRGEAEPLLGRADAVGQARALEALYAAAAERTAA